jgi:hypothetical protein
MACLVSRLRSRAGRVAEQLGELGAATMPLEQRLCRDGPKASAVHLARRSSLGAETRCSAPSRWLRVRAAGSGNGDFMLDRRAARDDELFLGSSARSTRPAARVDGRARNGAAEQQFPAPVWGRFPASWFRDDLPAHSRHDSDAPLCCGAVRPQCGQRHTRPQIRLCADTKTGSSLRLIWGSVTLSSPRRHQRASDGAYRDRPRATRRRARAPSAAGREVAKVRYCVSPW